MKTGCPLDTGKQTFPVHFQCLFYSSNIPSVSKHKYHLVVVVVVVVVKKDNKPKSEHRELVTTTKTTASLALNILSRVNNINKGKCGTMAVICVCVADQKKRHQQKQTNELKNET